MAGAPSALSAAYERRLVALGVKSAARVGAAFAAYQRRPSWPDLIGNLTVAWMATQVDAVVAADMMLAATSLATGGPMPWVPVAGAQLVGRSSGGTALLDVVAATPGIVANRQLNGYSREDAFAQSQRWLTGTITGDVDRVARDAVVESAMGPSPIVIGWQRIAEADACTFCRALATRGAVYKSEATAKARADGKRYHLRCRCRVEGVTSELTRRAGIKAGQAEWERMLATGDVPRITGRSKATAGAAAAPPTTVNLQRSWQLQLDTYRGTIPELEARVAAGDAAAEKPLAWQRVRVAELQRLLAAPAAA